MLEKAIKRRGIIVGLTATLLAGCNVIPKPATAPAPEKPTTPTAGQLPTDDNERHRIALLVPLSGANGGVGTSISNAANMAILDTNSANLRITAYDTAKGAAAAAKKAVADGNKLILGPLESGEIADISSTTKAARVPVISYSNDASSAGGDIFVMGQIPAQAVKRAVVYARGNGSQNFGILLPYGEYGRQISDSFVQSLKSSGGNLVASEYYNRGNNSVVSAAQRIAQNTAIDTILIADGARIATLAADKIRATASSSRKLIGTELLSGEAIAAKAPSMNGLIFAAISDARFARFSESYRVRFGAQPYRISTLGYDSVLLVLRIAQDWKIGTEFPLTKMRDPGGFLGLDGPFRFGKSGAIERAMEVREFRKGQVVIVSPAPREFGN